MQKTKKSHSRIYIKIINPVKSSPVKAVYLYIEVTVHIFSINNPYFVLSFISLLPSSTSLH